MNLGTLPSSARRHGNLRLPGARLFACFPLFGVVLALLLSVTQSFEVFSEQQILKLKPDAKVGAADYNNSELGSTYIDDYWAKIDINYSPLDGWSLIKYVKIGCFDVRFVSASSSSYATKTLATVDKAEEDCTLFCNGTQAYIQFPLCRCALNETDIVLRELKECQPTMWEIYRHFDYRSSMQPTAYDVARRFLYQLVSIRMMHVDPPVRDYIHAINVFENKPAFKYDTRLDRTVFNAVWDFRKSRLVALSWYPDDDPQLYFSTVSFNTTHGKLITVQQHTLIQDQIAASGSLLAQFTSVDGMGTVDILFGTYYSSVPAQLPETPVVVDIIVAIDVDRKKVLNSVTLPVTLMNMQINCLTHVLYGSGLDLFGRLAYFELCTAENVTKKVGSVTQTTAVVECEVRELGELPSQVNQMYLQSASIDHHYNYAWFAYKEVSTGPPLILEYHQDDAKYIRWREDSLPLEAVFSSLIQTAPRIIFVLYPPTLEYAKFNAAGTKIFLQFTMPTLQGAIPQDSDGDEIPDYWNEADKKTREPCEMFLDDFTMQMIEGAMCQWISDARMFIEITMGATIMPGDLVRLRSNRIYAGRISPSGVAQFSQPSTDFKEVQVPDSWLPPTADISAFRFIDACTSLTLDGEGSQNYGFRGPFRWSLNRTEPPASEPEVNQIIQLLRDARFNDPYKNPHIIRIPKSQLQENYMYYFDLNVTTLWDPSESDLKTHGVLVSPLPVPPISILGSTTRLQNPAKDMYISAEIQTSPCMNTLSGFDDPIFKYTWTGCLGNQTKLLFAGIEGCDAWHAPLLEGGKVSGIRGRNLRVEALTMDVNTRYVFTVKGELTSSDGSNVMLSNIAVVIIDTTIGRLDVITFGGDGFSAPIRRPLVLDMVQVEQGCYGPTAAQGAASIAMCADVGVTYNFSCTIVATGLPCDLGCPGDVPADPGLGLSPSPTPTPSDDPGLSFSPSPSPTPSPGAVSGSRRLSGCPVVLENVPCAPVYNKDSGAKETFHYRDKNFYEAMNITVGTPSPYEKYCFQQQGLLIIQPNFFEVGKVEFVVNMSKNFAGTIRTTEMTVLVDMIEESEGGDGRYPLIALKMKSPYPVNPSVVNRFIGAVTNEVNGTVYEYSWQAFQWTANPDYDPDQATTNPNYTVARYSFVEMKPPVIDFASNKHFRTAPGSKYLAINPWTLSPSMQYRLRMNVIDTVARAAGITPFKSYSEITFTTVGLPPSGGILRVANSTGIGFVTEFALELTGWGTEDLPLTYGFGYKRDPSDPYEIISYLSTIFTERSYIDTILPMGAVGPDYILNVYGYVKSSYGVLTESNPVALMVRPPEDPTVMLKLIQRVPNLDPEGALLLAKMIVQVQEVSNPPSPMLNMTLQAIVSTVRSLDLAKTEGLVYDFSNFLEVVAFKGLRLQQVLDNMAWCTNKSVEWGLLSLDKALTPNDVNLAIALLSATDVLMPGVVTEAAASGARRLQVFDPSENRTPDEQWDQLMQLKEQQRLIGGTMLAGLFPGEMSHNMSVRGCDLFLGKEYTLENPDLAVQGNVSKTFKVPSLDFIESTYGREVFSFRYQIFKKFPYSFWDVPERHSLTAPADDAGTGGLRIPRQEYTSAGRLWYAMTLDIGSEAGDSIPAEIKASLENSTFDRLIKIDASGAKTMGQYSTIDYAATCYAVGLDGSLPRFDSKGVTFDEESCISTQLNNFVVLIDDLPKEIEAFESFSRGTSLEISEDRPATAAVGTLLICILCGVAAGAFGIYIDEKEHDKTPIDLSKKRVVDDPDPLEKLIQTLILTFRRNHLVVGMLVKHRKLTREKRVWIMMVAGLSTQSVATVLHANSLIKFRATSQFLATGLTAGVLVFPLTVFLQFLYEWRPMTRMHSYAPPRSVPAPNLERKDAQKQTEMAQVKSLHQPKRPPIPMKVRPPPRSAAPRVPLMSQLSLPVMAPGLPLDLPKLKTGNGKIAPPPRLQPQKPRPPKEPPPEEHLMVTRPPASTFGDSIASRGSGLSGSLGSSTGSPGPFGLTLPELPPLLQGASSAVTGKATPAPPPKKSGAGPRPPQAPPPVSKMFFAVPAGSVLRQHGLPAPPPKPPAFGLPKGPSLPPLPRMMPPRDTLSAVRLSAGPELPSGRTLPPPPPPPLILNGGGFGAAPPPPETPREDTLMMTLPGTLDQTPRGPPSFRGAPEDVEFTSGLPHARFVMDPEHAMMPPGAVPSQTPQPPPPPKRMPPNGSAKAPGIPALPSAASSSLALAPLPELPGGVTSPPPPRPPPGEHLAVSTSPSGAQWGQLAVPEVVDSRMELVLAPLRHLPGHGRIPALPGNLPPPVALPNSVLAKVPAIQRESGLLPPPPPPPVGGFGRLALMPLPPEDGEPTVVQKLTVWKAPPRRGGPTSTPPRPPPRMPSAPLRPKPPIGPPPAHAIVLARKAGAPGFNADAIVSAARPPPVGKAAPPSGPPPQNQRRDLFALISKQDVDEIAKHRNDIAKNPNKDMTIDGLDPFALGRTDPRLFVGAAKKRHDEKAPKPVPDYIVQYSLGAVQLFVVFNILVFTGIITLYGTYLPPSAVYPTYAATIVGVVINLGLFESVKCVVICCLSMVHDESEKRDLELRARRARMEMKAQRFQQRGRRFVVNEKNPGH